ncbi:hypothetical protein U9K47_10455, partial [Bacillus toyonensis]|uniref:hypothetical protein n=1 Tax=Bacillus toyonensis TaxID=155322 RepID=UPI0034677E14
MFVPLNDNNYAIVNKSNGLVVTPNGMNTQPTNLDDWYWENKDPQRWKPEYVGSFSLPSIATSPLDPPPEYEYAGQVLPDYTPETVTNYTLAPSIAVVDPWYNDQQKMQTGNEYYLYVREQYWLKVFDHTFAPDERFMYTQISGIKDTDLNTVSKTVSHTYGADAGLMFGKEGTASLSASMSYQYSEELMIQETKVNEELRVVEKELEFSNSYDQTVSWTKYILVNRFYIQRADGTIVNEPWTVTDENTTRSVSYPPGLELPTESVVDIELSHARKAVYNLFADANHSKLKLDTTDYRIDQAALQVEQISNEEDALEKMQLFDLVRCAKRLSTKRNLLHYGDFASPNWRNREDGWQASYNVTVLSDNPVFKGPYANMPGANARNGNTPTYLYQKVDESKLKPYTRYLVRGFVGSSKELELFVTRYGKEVHSKMNIPTNTCKQISDMYRLEQCSDYSLSSDPCQPTYMPPAKELCEDKQHFVFHIDVGEIYPRTDLGIGVGFRISSPSGMAQLSNIEVIEANPLTGEALARVKKREKKWRKEMEQQCAQTEKAISSATQAMDHLFTDAQKNRLRAMTTMQDIQNAEAKVKALPFVYNPYFEEIPGMNYDTFQALQFDVYTASNLYRGRNVIRNGDFSSGLSNWHATSGADVQEKGGKPHVLVISQWDTNVSQEVCVQPDHGYILRVTARKEGSGKGYVTLTDCTADNTETVTFLSD